MDLAEALDWLNPAVIGGHKCSRPKRETLGPPGPLWMRIWRVFVTGRSRVTFNSTTHRDDRAGAHKSVYEPEKDHKQ